MSYTICQYCIFNYFLPVLYPIQLWQWFLGVHQPLLLTQFMSYDFYYGTFKSDISMICFLVVFYKINAHNEENVNKQLIRRKFKMKLKQFLDNYRIWKKHYRINHDGKYRIYEKGDWKYILFNGLISLTFGLIFMVIFGIILFNLVM